jgi:hypothetical protein
MNKSTHQREEPVAAVASPGGPSAGVTRRTVLTSAVVATAAVAVVGVNAPAAAQVDINEDDMRSFLTLSAALTGIARGKLAPFADPFPDLRAQYFKRASGMADESQRIRQNDKRKADFGVLLKITRDLKLPDSPPGPPGGNGIIKQEDVDRLTGQIGQASKDVQYLARSIVLMWYLGSWFEPDKLRDLGDGKFIGHEVISPAAYTNGFVWRIAQAHPMGYSDMQFGYWTYPAQPMEDFIAMRQAKG